MINNYKPQFLSYLHSFRGFANLNIVAIHAIGLALIICNSHDPKDPFNIANELLFHNSTIYFAVISGLLFSLVLDRKGYKAFYSSKFKNVLLPYLFLTCLFSIFIFSPQNPFAVDTDHYPANALRNFIYGKAQFTYWYIPVLIFLYAVTPVLNYIMKSRWGIYITVLIILLPLLISRVELIDSGQTDSLSLRTMIYFTGAYAAGMLFGREPETYFAGVRINMLLLILITLCSSAALLYFEFHDVDKFGFWSLRSTLFYIQKMCLSGIIIVAYKSRGIRQPRWLFPIANNAFAIYFLHAFCLLIMYALLMQFGALSTSFPLNFLLTAVLLFLSSILMSIMIAWIFKKLLGKYSKMFVGA